ncbi:hypothetical protein [Bacillus sp. 103mf]|nr:hypothetical protein [Bacillus sp. 103mf]
MSFLNLYIQSQIGEYNYWFFYMIIVYNYIRTILWCMLFYVHMTSRMISL